MPVIFQTYTINPYAKIDSSFGAAVRRFFSSPCTPMNTGLFTSDTIALFLVYPDSLFFHQCTMTFTVATPREFSYERCYEFLQRSPREVLHRCTGNHVRKLLRFGEEIFLIEVGPATGGLKVAVVDGATSPDSRKMITAYIKEWFDLETDLAPFYKLAKKDALLKDLVAQHYGYRIIGQPDLFESLVWAVLGQQINLQFAYTLKQRFVEQFGSSLEFEGTVYWLFPTPQEVAALTDSQLLPLQFSRQKSSYTLSIADAFARGEVTKAKLMGLTLAEAKQQLIHLKGVGNWTANYALMKTFRYPDAFPLEDAGIHNALKALLKLERKPTLDKVKEIFASYSGWEAYATLYLWKSL